jgi:hypothetical protein
VQLLDVPAHHRSFQGKTPIPPDGLHLLTAPDGVGRGYALRAMLDGLVPHIAVDKLARVGSTNVWMVIDGFEGAAGSDGKRDKNGWRNSGLPWNHALDA